MSQFSPGQKVKITKPPHIFEGVIIMPGSPAEIKEVHDDGTVSLTYYDREMIPHTMPGIKESEIVLAESQQAAKP
jgi:hypothetical protein